MGDSTCTTAPVRASRTSLLRRMPWPGSAGGAEHEPLLTREWLVCQRARRLRVRHRIGRDDAQVSRAARGGAAGALRPRRDAQPPGRAHPAARRPQGGARRRGARRLEPGAARGAVPARVQARSRAPGVAVRPGWMDDREAPAAAVPPEHGAHHVRALAGDGTLRLEAPSVAALPASRGARSACRWSTRTRSRSSRIDTKSPAKACRRCGC